MSTVFSKEVLEQVDTLFRQARVSLIKTHAWWGSLSLRLTPVYTDEVGYSATDGKRVFVNPVTFLKLDINDRRSIVLHETLHPALGHLFRREERESKELWNIATDICIHNISEAEGVPVIQKPDEDVRNFLFTLGFHQGRRHFVGMTSEKIYETLLQAAKKQDKNKKVQGGGQGTALNAAGAVGGEGGCCRKRGQDESEKDKQSHGKGEGDKRGTNPSDSLGEEPTDAQLAREWRAATVEAAIRAGSRSATLTQLINEVSKARVSWADYLHEFLNRGLNGDFSWLPVNRRYIHEGQYLPTTQDIEVGEIALIVDTSGSMDEKKLGLAFGECKEFRRMYGCDVHFIECDAGVAAYTYYSRGENLPEQFKAHGRGGTSFNPPFEFLQREGVIPKLALYFTDGEGSCNVPTPPYPVLWVQIPHQRGSGEYNPPFGERIIVHEDD